MAKIISFVSFKGGSGRSVALSNVAFQLAKENKVGCIDFDIEGGGLNEVFLVGDIGKQSIQHYLTDEQDYYEFHAENQPDYSDKGTFIDNLVIDIKNNPVSGIGLKENTIQSKPLTSSLTRCWQTRQRACQWYGQGDCSADLAFPLTPGSPVG